MTVAAKDVMQRLRITLRGAVARLRERKHREEKPFALMMPSLEMARQYCEISSAEVELLESLAAPIVLLRPKPGTDRAALDVS